MVRLILIAMGLVFLAVMVVGLKTCSHSAPLSSERGGDLSSVVALPNGSVLTAPKGTVGRDMVDWLASDGDTERRFELGGKEFEGRSIEPTVESKVRIERGIAILKANPNVSLEVIGYAAATGDGGADMKLGQARADWIVNALHDGGIASNRLTARSRGGADPIGDNRTPEGRARNERVAMILRHQH